MTSQMAKNTLFLVARGGKTGAVPTKNRHSYIASKMQTDTRIYLRLNTNVSFRIETESHVGKSTAEIKNAATFNLHSQQQKSIILHKQIAF